MSQPPKSRRVILPPPPPDKATVIIQSDSDIQQILKDGLSVIGTQIVKYKHKVSMMKEDLDPGEARILTGYVKALVEIDKLTKEKEDEDAKDAASMSDEEFIALAEALKAKKAAK